jgi:hypothetical protein
MPSSDKAALDRIDKVHRHGVKRQYEEATQLENVRESPRHDALSIALNNTDSSSSVGGSSLIGTLQSDMEHQCLVEASQHKALQHLNADHQIQLKKIEEAFLLEQNDLNAKLVKRQTTLFAHLQKLQEHERCAQESIHASQLSALNMHQQHELGQAPVVSSADSSSAAGSWGLHRPSTLDTEARRGNTPNGDKQRAAKKQKKKGAKKELNKEYARKSRLRKKIYPDVLQERVAKLFHCARLSIRRFAFGSPQWPSCRAPMVSPAHAMELLQRVQNSMAEPFDARGGVSQSSWSSQSSQSSSSSSWSSACSSASFSSASLSDRASIVAAKPQTQLDGQ